MGSTSKAFSLSKIKVGSKTKTLRKRLKGERRYRVGQERLVRRQGQEGTDALPDTQEQGAGAGAGRQAA